MTSDYEYGYSKEDTGRRIITCSLPMLMSLLFGKPALHPEYDLSGALAEEVPLNQKELEKVLAWHRPSSDHDWTNGT